MTKLKKLQDQYLNGEITQAQYETELQALLDDGVLDQDQYDTAIEYDPEHEKPQFSQSDVDSMIVSKAVKMVRKALKDAGVTIEADNKTLFTAIAQKLKSAQDGTTGASDDADGGNDGEVAALQAKAALVDTLRDKITALNVENAVLREAGKYKPVNPVQVVRALQSPEYADLIDVDDESGDVDVKSVSRALKKCSESEPNLFQADDTDTKGADFKGKGPGGGSGSADNKLAAKKQEALKMLGLNEEK